MRTLRIGAGAGFSGDRIEPAVDLAEHGALDYLVFECLAERTIALAQAARRQDPQAGYDPLLEERMRAVLPACRANGVRIVTNMGAANPQAATAKTVEIARELGLTGLRVAAVTGDDVLAPLLEQDAPIEETGRPISGFGDRLVSANAYLGAAPIVGALAQGADVVITGRVADPALFLGPQIHEFCWAMDDWTRLGRGAVAGHLLECAGQITGGFFADPGRKDVPDLARLGFPIGEIEPSGEFVVTKLETAGGRVSTASVAEQLLYEVHDPAAYAQPDVLADFSQVRIEEVARDRVRVSGGDGRPRSGRLKVSVGYVDSCVGEGQISYAGPGAVARGRLAIEIMDERLTMLGLDCLERRGELIGVDSVMAADPGAPEPAEVRMRYAARTETMDQARRIGREVEALYLNGPAGGGGVTRSAREVIAVATAFIDADSIRPTIEILES